MGLASDAVSHVKAITRVRSQILFRFIILLWAAGIASLM